MITTLLQILIPLAYVITGTGIARLIWQNMREVPQVRGSDPVNCFSGYHHEDTDHHSSCYEIIQEQSGDNFDAGMCATFGGLFWPIAILAGLVCLGVTWHTPLTRGEKILAMRKAEEELRKATRRMEAAKRKADNG